MRLPSVWDEDRANAQLVAVLVLVLVTVIVAGILVAFVTSLNPDNPETPAAQTSMSATATADGCIAITLTNGDTNNLSQYSVRVSVSERGNASTLSLPLSDSQISPIDYNGDHIFDTGQPYGGTLVSGGEWNIGESQVVCLKPSMVNEDDQVKVTLIDDASDKVIQTDSVQAQPANEETDNSDWEYASLVFKQQFDLYSHYQEQVTDQPVKLEVPYDSCMADDYSDLRITQTYANGSEEPVEFYVDQDASTDSLATVWVVAGELSPDTESTLNVYYGLDGSATCESTTTVRSDGGHSSPDSPSVPPNKSDDSVATKYDSEISNYDDDSVSVSAGTTVQSPSSTARSGSTQPSSEPTATSPSPVEVAEDSQTAGMVGSQPIQSSPVAVTPNLIGYWPMNEETGDSTVEDYTNYNHGGVNGPQAGQPGILNSNAYQFDGEGVLDFTSHSYELDELTFTGWVHFDETTSGGETIVEFNDDIAIQTTSGGDELQFTAAGETVSESVPRDEWVFFAARGDASEISLRINDREVKSQSVESNLGLDSGFVVGDSVASEDGYSGRVDELALYEGTLGENKIDDMYWASDNETFHTTWRQYPVDVNESTLFLHNIDADLNGESITVRVQSDSNMDGEVDETSESIKLDGETQRYEVDGITEDSYRYRLEVHLETESPARTPVFRQGELTGKIEGPSPYGPNGDFQAYDEPDYETLPETTGSTPPDAEVTMATEVARAGDEVVFSVSGGADPDGADENLVYKWDFDGDGQTEELGESVSYAFESSGNQTVQLTVIDETDTSTIVTKSVDVQAAESNMEPDTSLSVSSTAVNESEVVSFDASESMDPEGDSLSYEWDFDDGGGVDATGETTTHSYSTHGEKTAVVRVEDSKGAVSTESVTIAVNGLPNARVSASDVAVKEEEEVSFDASSSSDPDGTIQSYEWDFDGDGEVDATGPQQTYAYEMDGQYDATVTITDDDGGKDTATVSLTVEQRITTSSPNLVTPDRWSDWSNEDAGIVVNPNKEVNALDLTFYSGMQRTVNRIRIEDVDADKIVATETTDSGWGGGSTATLSGLELQPDTKYWIRVDRTHGSYFYHPYITGVSYPRESELIDVTAGIDTGEYGSVGETSGNYFFSDLVAYSSGD